MSKAIDHVIQAIIACGDPEATVSQMAEPLARAAILALLDHMRQEAVSEGVQHAGHMAIPGGHGQAWIYAPEAFRAMLTAYRDEIAGGKG